MKNNLDAHHSLALYAVAIFLIIIGLFLSEYNPPVNKVFSNPSPTISETTNLTTKNILFLNPMEFKSRNYSTDDYFMQNEYSDKSEFKKYPKILTDISEQSLQKIRCSQSIQPESDENNIVTSYIETDQSKVKPLTDKAILRLLKNITKYGETIRQARYCEIAGSNPIIYYSLRNHEQPNQRKSGIYFDTVNEDLTTTTQLNIIDDNAGYYFSCSDTLQITTDNRLYVVCGGGDLAYTSTINIVDFNAGTITGIYQCVDRASEDGSKPPHITCEIPKKVESNI